MKVILYSIGLLLFPWQFLFANETINYNSIYEHRNNTSKPLAKIRDLSDGDYGSYVIEFDSCATEKEMFCILKSCISNVKNKHKSVVISFLLDNATNKELASSFFKYFINSKWYRPGTKFISEHHNKVFNLFFLEKLHEHGLVDITLKDVHSGYALTINDISKEDFKLYAEVSLIITHPIPQKLGR